VVFQLATSFQRNDGTTHSEDTICASVGSKQSAVGGKQHAENKGWQLGPWGIQIDKSLPILGCASCLQLFPSAVSEEAQDCCRVGKLRNMEKVQLFYP